MFVAIAHIPDRPEALKLAASAAGMTLADASRLLAGPLPRVLVRTTPDGQRIASALEALGFVAFTGDIAEIPSEKHRVVARSLEWIPGGLVALDGRGQRHECGGESIALLQRGARLVETSEVIKTTERKLDMGQAVISGGLMLTRKVETTHTHTESSKEGLLLIQRGEGAPDIILHERRFNYACLGKDLQPSTLGNLMALLERLKTLAPGIPAEDRAARPGYVTNLPLMAADPVDLALFLVARSRQRGY